MGTLSISRKPDSNTDRYLKKNGDEMGDGATERVLLVLLATCVLFFMVLLLVRGC